jgi:hypothetical protein
MQKGCRKRPWRICRRWISPDPRLKGRQMTCGEAACRREWAQEKVLGVEWRELSEPLKRERLARKLEAVAAEARRQANATTGPPPRAAPVRCQ